MNERGLNARLTNREKAELSMQAREAYGVLSRAGAIDETCDEFRHRVAIQACGRRVSEALRADYAAISAAFLSISGKTARAVNVALRGETEPERIAMHKLHDELRKADLSLNYAGAICARQFHCELRSATAKQLWSIIFTIRNRAAKKRKAAADPC